MFVSISDLYDTNEGHENNLWVTSSYDASSHFESASDEILSYYQKIVGEKLDLNIEPDE
jgi:Rab GDP dissociation inhibitor